MVAVMLRTPNPDPLEVSGPGGETFTIVARPSGVIGWQYEASALPEGLFVALAAALWNTLGRLAFRFGWSLAIYRENSDKCVGRRRYRSKRLAVEDLPLLAKDLSAAGLPALRGHQGDRP